MTHVWITDRPPTNEDGDKDGDVIVCTSPTLCEDSYAYEKWHDVTLYWPWRHCDSWTPPAPAPELTPPAPEPEPEKAKRGFLEFTRTENGDYFIYTAVATDYTAWVFDSKNTANWCQIPPLPQPGEE